MNEVDLASGPFHAVDEFEFPLRSLEFPDKMISTGIDFTRCSHVEIEVFHILIRAPKTLNHPMSFLYFGEEIISIKIVNETEGIIDIECFKKPKVPFEIAITSIRGLKKVDEEVES